MITLHYHPGNANLTPHMLLEEIGTPFELALVDRDHGALASAAFRKLNPNGKIPVLVDGDLVLYETAAICLYLVDRFPDAKLARAIGTSERAHFYKWLVWCASTMQAMLMHFFYPARLVDEGNANGAKEVKSHAQAQIGGMLDTIEAELAAHGKPWLLGDAFSAVDPYVLMLGRWTRSFERPARSLPHLGPYLQRVLARPAARTAVRRVPLLPGRAASTIWRSRIFLAAAGRRRSRKAQSPCPSPILEGPASRHRTAEPAVTWAAPLPDRIKRPWCQFSTIEGPGSMEP